MTTKDELRVLAALRHAPFTQGMASKHIKKLATIAVGVKFDYDEIIFREGDEGRAIYLIEEGEVVVESHVASLGQMSMLTLGPGELLGWSSLFPPRRKTSSARAAKPTWAIAIDTDQLQEAFQTDQELENVIIRRIADVIANRLKATRQRLIDNLAEEARNLKD
jgi:CRP-like cAMP-binding protein